jgi:hypothetical protein
MSEENNDIRVQIAKSDRLTSKEYLTQTKVILRSGVYTQPYDFQKLIDLTRSEVYINRCMNKLVESIYKKKFKKGTSDRILKLFTVQKREMIGFNMERAGNNFLEVVVSGGKTVSVYTSACQSWKKGYKKLQPSEVAKMIKADKSLNEIEIKDLRDNGLPGYWQNKGTGLSNERFFEGWNPDPDKGSLKKDGHYIYHLMRYNGDANIGIPDWLPAQDSIQLVKFVKKHNISIFVNNLEPRKIILVRRDKDLKMGETESKRIKDFFKENFDTVEKSNKALIIETQNAQVEVVDVVKGQMEGDFMSLDDSSKLDICNATGVPPILIGLQFSGKLGSSNEIQDTMIEFNNDTVQPKRDSFLEMVFEITGEKVEMEEIYIPQSKTPAKEFTDAVKSIYNETKEEFER